jgi:oligopeptide/dipeptide ABC transporter ATP-binding protein
MSLEATRTTSGTDVDDPILEIRDASVSYDDGETFVLDHVDLAVERGEILGVVGESGSGKSMLASAMLDAIPSPGRLSGEVLYHPDEDTTVDVLDLSKNDLREYRWADVSMVFQGAMSSFNPTMKVGSHFKETLRSHDRVVADGMTFARELLSDLYLDPERVLDSYPHELSGGMQQRALIALSLVLEPDVLVMDEPTAALDLLMQRSILTLLEDLKEKYGLTMVFITHDLPLVASLADRMAVMYAFDLAEVGPRDRIIGESGHPYTRALLNATPNIDAPLEEMKPIPGKSPAPINVPDGCSYAERCPLATADCRNVDPELAVVEDDHAVACHHWEDARREIPLNFVGPGGDRASSSGGERP